MSSIQDTTTPSMKPDERHQFVSTKRRTVKTLMIYLVSIFALVASGYLFMKQGLTPKVLALLISYFSTAPFVRLKIGHGPALREQPPIGCEVTTGQPVGSSSEVRK